MQKGGRTLFAVLAQELKLRNYSHKTLKAYRSCLRSYLLESGVDLRYIQELLGHSSSKTTQIYTHVSKKSLGKIVNPLDQALQLETK